MKNTKCKNWKDCVYANEKDCKTYIQCHIGADKRTGVPVVMKCPAALEWNDNDKICDFKKKSTCSKKNKPDQGFTTEDPNEDLGDLEATEKTDNPDESKPLSKFVLG